VSDLGPSESQAMKAGSPSDTFNKGLGRRVLISSRLVSLVVILLPKCCVRRKEGIVMLHPGSFSIHFSITGLKNIVVCTGVLVF